VQLATLLLRTEMLHRTDLVMNRQCACTYAIEPTGLIQPVGAPTQASETAGSAPVKIDTGSYPHIPHIMKKTQNFRSMVDPTSQEI